MKTILLLFIASEFIFSLPENPGPYKAGWTSITLNRSGRSMNCRIYYPSFVEGNGSQIDTIHAPYQIIGFGHGFAMQTSYYLSLFRHLASHGYVVIAPQFPDTQHGELANDLLFCINYIKQQNNVFGSRFYKLIDTTQSGLFGHSMGGGASLLAASRDSTVKVAAPLAAAETNPSAIASMNLIKGVVYLISGQSDGITPVNTNQLPMYNNANPIKALPIIKGGNHTKFMDVSIWDWTDPNGNISRTEQLRLTRRYLTSIFNLFLKEDTTYFKYALGNIIKNDANMIFSSQLKPLIPMSFDIVFPKDTIVPPPQVLKWRSTYSLNLEDTVKYEIIFSSNAMMTDTLSRKFDILDTTTTINLSPRNYFWRVKAYTSPSAFKFSNQVFNFTSKYILNLNLLIQGLYDSISMIPDTVTAELRSSISPYTLIAKEKSKVDSNGNALFYFSSVVNSESYYIVVKHRNSIETWSSIPQQFIEGTMTYNFTSSRNSAYGNNLIFKGTKWCIYNGDVNQDGFVDLTDLLLIDNDAFNLIYGYVPTDIDGDGLVSALDLNIVDNNAYNYVSAVKPSD